MLIMRRLLTCWWIRYGRKARKSACGRIPLFVILLACAVSCVRPVPATAPSFPATKAKDTPAPTATGLTEARVVDVVDGDTIKVDIDGTVYSVRYIGMDCPETNHPSKGLEWLGPEATAANAELVAGRTVLLEKDVSETDRYGRLLRYVYAGDVFVNRELVRLGFAQVSTYPPDVANESVFVEAQHEARQAGQGLWSRTATAEPGQKPGSGAAAVRIKTVDKRSEFVDVVNTGAQAQDLAGWVLVSEKGDQRCTLGGVIQPGATLRIYALGGENTATEYYCNFGENIWNNSDPDPAVLLDATGGEVDRE